MDEEGNDNEIGQDTDGAAIPTSDVVPGKMVISYDKNNPSMEVGTLYPTMEEFKLAVRQFSINKEFDLEVEKSCKMRYRAFCKSGDEDCPCKWVASKAVSIFRVDPNIGAKELQKKLETNHKCQIAYDTVWRGKQRALEEVYGKWEESFELLFRWKAEVIKRCPGSVVEIEVLEVDGQIYFHRFFCALKPCIDGFLEGCRPHLSIDATILNGRWNGHLAAVVAVDGHNWMYPLAYGFIASKNTDNWTWFMEQLKKAIGDPPLLAVCSDACKGLENVVKNVFPNAEQRECFYHLVRNLKKRFRGFGQIYPAARAYREDISTTI
ncbi:uncharacterized protein [Miscanthus floridulus]|uniref:uncharacterized protein n=1 Tax=Miscanthus floridulus TaxID=154761 RepID=UPI00345918CC